MKKAGVGWIFALRSFHLTDGIFGHCMLGRLFPKLSREPLCEGQFKLFFCYPRWKSRKVHPRATCDITEGTRTLSVSVSYQPHQQ